MCYTLFWQYFKLKIIIWISKINLQALRTTFDFKVFFDIFWINPKYFTLQFICSSINCGGHWDAWKGRQAFPYTVVASTKAILSLSARWKFEKKVSEKIQKKINNSFCFNSWILNLNKTLVWCVTNYATQNLKKKPQRPRTELSASYWLYRIVYTQT